MSIRYVILLPFVIISVSLGAQVSPKPPTAREMLREARETLALQVAGVLARSARASSDAAGLELVFAISAMAGTSPGPGKDPHAAVLDQARSWLRLQQGSNGAFLSPPLDREAAYYSLGIFASSTRTEDVEAMKRSQEFLLGARGGADHSLRPPSSRPPAEGSVANALNFLRATSQPGASGRRDPTELETPESQLLGRHAGIAFDARAARQHLLKSFHGNGANLTRALGLPNRGGVLQDIHLAARVLAATRSPRIVDELGRTHLWPRELLEGIAHLRSGQRGFFVASAGGEPSLAATAAAALALDGLGPWLVTLSPESLQAASMREAESPAELSSDCEGCHEQLHPDLVYQWRQSRHSSADVGCASCHGKNHSQIFRENGAVSPGVCGACHARETEQFARSRHARAESSLLESALFAATPTHARGSCRACHAIGKAQADGTHGSCGFCHSAHSASAAEAREPEACTGCHTGDDYPQALAYQMSKHGAIYLRTRDPRLAPTCGTCHHPSGNHETSFGITVGGSGSGGHVWDEEPAIPMERVTPERFAERRAEMVRICVSCHSSRFVEDSFVEADGLKREGNRTIGEAAQELRSLFAEGLLGAPNVGTLTLGGRQVRVDPRQPGSLALNRFYDMWRYHYAWTWKGAYHSSPSVTNLESRPGLETDLEWIRAEATRLREERKPNARIETPKK